MRTYPNAGTRALDRPGLFAELVSIPTSTAPLDGLYYRARSQAAGGALLMHGNMRNFYSGPSRFLPPYLVERGFDCLAYNRRGHDILTTGDDRLPQGGAFQTAAEAREDDDLAASFLASCGHAEPIVIGHSNGGMLAASFAAEHPETRALVLLSAHAGGPEHIKELAHAGLLGAHRQQELLAQAEALVDQGRGDELLQTPGWWYLISATSLVDRVYRTPTTVEQAPDIKCPVLFIKGAGESNELYPAEAFAEQCRTDCEVVQLPDCNHFYTGHEATVADLITGWLGRVIPDQPASDPSRPKGGVYYVGPNPD